MDGLPGDLARDMRDRNAGGFQRTLKAPIHCMGVGLHSGRDVRLMFMPAPPGSGVVFRRTDLPHGLTTDIPALFDSVVDTKLCTVVAAPGAPEIRVGTVEHVMAALLACGVDNVIVAVDGPEIPVLDGSAAPFVFLIDCAGIIEQGVPRRMVEVLRPVRVSEGESFAELRPGTGSGLEMSVSIAFDAPAIGRQALSLRLGDRAFREELASARTFAMAADIAGLKAAGLAQGGSLDNAVVVDGASVLNPAGLRMADEFVRHKMLDVVGDLALAGATLLGRFSAHRPGHSLNNRLLRALFADQDAWAWVDRSQVVGWTGLQAAA